MAISLPALHEFQRNGCGSRRPAAATASGFAGNQGKRSGQADDSRHPCRTPGCCPHTATELTGRLVAAGLVARVVDLADRRRHTLELTIEAEHILERLSSVHLAEIRELAPKFIDVLIKLNKMANEPE
ncbi:MarR family transcriptional regulator [Brucella abortus]|nr:MarR family transcriptional regulator [Brucella abortus]